MRVHDSGGKEFFNKELHQQVLWWSQLLQLLQPLESKAAIEQRVQLAADQAERAGFWLVNQYFRLSVGQTIKTWSIMETVLSVTGLVVVLLLDLVI